MEQGLVPECSSYAHMGSVNLSGISKGCICMSCIARLAEPKGESVEDHSLHCLSNGGGISLVNFGSKGDSKRASVEKHGIEGTGGSITAIHGGVALVGLV